MKIKISDVKKAAKKHLRLDTPLIKKLGCGESNTNFVVNNRYIIRVNADYKEKKKMNREYRILKHLNKHAYGPKVYAKDTSKTIIPQDFIIIEFFLGKDLTKSRLSKKMIKDLAKTTAILHNLPTNKNLPKFRQSYKEVKTNIEYLIKLTKKFGGKKDAELLAKSLSKLKTAGPKNTLTIAHGDICEQNLIYDKQKQLRFIDFESCGISDPAYDIADISTGFGKEFKKQHIDLFLEEYTKYRKDNTLKKRLDVFVPLKMFETLCWAVMHVYEIQAGIVSDDIKERTPIKEHTDYAMYCLRKCKEMDLLGNDKIKLFKGVA